MVGQKIRAFIAADLSINTAVCCFNNGVACHPVFIGRAVSIVGVIACAAFHAVCTQAAIQNVVAAVAQELVIQLIAKSVQIGCAQKHAPFQVRDQMNIQAGFNGVVATSRSLDNHIASIIHHIGVITATTLHVVTTCTAIQAIIILATQKRIIPAQAKKGAATVVGSQNIVQLITRGHRIPGAFQQA